MSLKKTPELDALFHSMLSLKSIDECYLYFEDLCTMKELRDLGQRLEIARLLSEGASYVKAVEATGVSSATIGRVKKCLDYGTGGYEMILRRLKELDTNES